MQTALRYFAVFGGLEKKINTEKPLEMLIEAIILDSYTFYRNEISELTSKDNLYRAILSGIALGDRRTNSAFKRAKVSFNQGMECVDDLRHRGILSLETSRTHFKEPFEYQEVSDKLVFNAPFLRFWFAFVSPIFKGIQEGDYSEFFERYKNRSIEFEEFVFEQLSHEYMKELLKDVRFEDFGRYWDDEMQVDLICRTKEKKLFAGRCKYSNAKMKKSELNIVKEQMQKLGLEADTYVLFAKSGFTNELKAMKSDNLKLFTCRNFKALV